MVTNPFMVCTYISGWMSKILTTFTWLTIYSPILDVVMKRPCGGTSDRSVRCGDHEKNEDECLKNGCTFTHLLRNSGKHNTTFIQVLRAYIKHLNVHWKTTLPLTFVEGLDATSFGTSRRARNTLKRMGVGGKKNRKVALGKKWETRHATSTVNCFGHKKNKTKKKAVLSIHLYLIKWPPFLRYPKDAFGISFAPQFACCFFVLFYTSFYCHVNHLVHDPPHYC